MAEAILTRVGPNAFTLDSEGSILTRLKIGGKIKADVKAMRNPDHHRKYFALINTAFDWWEPKGVEYKGIPVAKNIERFRKDVQILAGYGHPVINIKGEVRMESESISFGSMDQEAFDALYNAVLQVILDKVLARTDAQRLNEAVEAVMSYA